MSRSVFYSIIGENPNEWQSLILLLNREPLGSIALYAGWSIMKVSFLHAVCVGFR